MRKNIILFTSTFFIFLIYLILYKNITNDELWCFGFSYNISEGLIPYKDFNLVITPLYPMLNAIFLLIFGKNILSFLIFNSLILAAITLITKKYNNNYLLGILLLLIIQVPSYNNLVILLFLLILYLEKEKKNDYLIGITNGLLILTKQNVGIIISILTLLFLKKENLLKRLKGIFIPLTIFVIYLFLTSTIYEFIDYTILGLFSFAENNISFSIYFLIEILIIIILLIKLYKEKLKNKNTLYILGFQIMAFPIFDKYHVLLAVYPFIINYIILNKKYFTVTKIIVISLIIFFNISIKEIPNSLNKFKYRSISNNLENNLIIVNNYINEKKKEYELFFLGDITYLLKIENNIKINKYDIINYGNMGLNGDNEYIDYIEKTCNSKKCMFLISNINYQSNKKILNHIKENYQEKENLYNISIHTN